MKSAIEAVNALAAMSLVRNGRCANCSLFIDGTDPGARPESAPMSRIGLIRFTLDSSRPRIESWIAALVIAPDTD